MYQEPDPKLLETTLPGKYREAVEGMRDTVFLAGQRYQEQQHRANREGVHPRILEFEAKFRKRMRDLGVPMFTHCVWRTHEAQAEMLAKGVSKAKPGESAHNYGCAIDFVHSLKAWQLNDQQWEALGHIGKEVASSLGVKVEWGGDWKFYDPAHWELVGWRDVKRLVDGVSVPEAAEILRLQKKRT